MGRATRRLGRDPRAWFGVTVVVLMVLAAVAAPLIARHDPFAIDLLGQLSGPSRDHWLGTDIQGRDVWARLVYGARVSLAAGIISQVIALSLGVLLGLIAGYYGRWVDVRVLSRHVLPAVIAPVVIAATLGVAAAIMAESSLSFLGLGVQPPTPSWGAMIADGRDLSQLRHAPWTSLFPGLAIGLAVLGFNLLGDALRDAIDPRTVRYKLPNVDTSTGDAHAPGAPSVGDE